MRLSKKRGLAQLFPGDQVLSLGVGEELQDTLFLPHAACSTLLDQGQADTSVSSFD